MARKAENRKAVKAEKKTVEFVIKTHDGKNIDPPIKSSYTYDVLGDDEQIPEDEQLDNLDLHDVVNRTRAANALAAARQTELQNAGLVESKFEDADKAFATLVQVFMVQLKMSKADAEAKARKNLGIE